MTAAKIDETDSSIVYAETESEAVTAWLKANMGEDVGVDDNICECETWTVGERRCSCGNRRIHAECMEIVPGKFLVYPEAD